MSKAKACYLVAILAVLALLVGACAPPPNIPPTPTPSPTPMPSPSPSPSPTPTIKVPDAAAARDAALEYLRDNYGDDAPDSDLAWQEEDTTPPGLVGAAHKYFTADEWAVTVSYPMVRPDLTMYQVTLTSLQQGWHWEGKVNADGTVTETSALREMAEEVSQQIAEEFVRNSPTFVFDGIEESLKLEEVLYPETEDAWGFVFRFESRHAGYGDRTGQVLAQVITPHEAIINVERGKVASAIMDGKWDMMKQCTIG